MSKKPERVRSAPGLVWKPRAGGIFEARWQCRTDILAKGYKVSSVRIGRWAGDPTKEDWDFIAETCTSLQDEMRAWSHGEEVAAVKFDNRTLGSLIDCYLTDKASDFRKLRHASKVHYRTIMRHIKERAGEELLRDINARWIKIKYEEWIEGGKITTGHTRMGMLRIVCGFGMTMLENKECERLSVVLSKLKFPQAAARASILTANQVVAIRKKAHELGRPSIALAQAIQFECALRQKDVIGEWVPLSEPVLSDLTVGKYKWARGVRWEEINSKLILTHVTSKRGKKIVISLHNAPMVLEEFEHVRREYEGTLPANGPIIRSEYDGLPWEATEFRRWWRQTADASGIPKEVRNMDSRAGAITEADDAEANPDDIREAATHSNISMTQRYTRNQERKIERVQMKRLEGRNRVRTSDD